MRRDFTVMGDTVNVASRLKDVAPPGQIYLGGRNLLLGDLFRRIATHRPLVLMFEDLHWADRSSINLLESLLRLVADSRLLFILVLRPDYLRRGVYFSVRLIPSQAVTESKREPGLARPLFVRRLLEKWRRRISAQDIGAGLTPAWRTAPRFLSTWQPTGGGFSIAW